MFRISSIAFPRAFHILKTAKRINYLTCTRHQGHVVRYRLGPNPPPKISVFFGEFLGGLFWWWVLWHCYTDYRHVLGEFEYPDPTGWTDDELGITDHPVDTDDDEGDNKMDEIGNAIGEEAVIEEEELKPKKRKIKRKKKIEEVDPNACINPK